MTNRINADKQTLTTKKGLDKVRGQQLFKDRNKGPAHKDSNRNDINDPIG